MEFRYVFDMVRYMFTGLPVGTSWCEVMCWVWCVFICHKHTYTLYIYSILYIIYIYIYIYYYYTLLYYYLFVWSVDYSPTMHEFGHSLADSPFVVTRHRPMMSHATIARRHLVVVVACDRR